MIRHAVTSEAFALPVVIRRSHDFPRGILAQVHCLHAQRQGIHIPKQGTEVAQMVTFTGYPVLYADRVGVVTV